MRDSSLNEETSEIAIAFDGSRLFQIVTAAITSAALGVSIGLLVAWVLWPVEFTSADPSDLRQRLKDDYVRMIGAAYVTDGNLSIARERLNQLGAKYSSKSFSDLLIREQKAGGDARTLDALALLAQGMGFGGLTIPSATPVVESITLDSLRTTSQTLPSYQIAERAMLTCTDEPNQPRMQFLARDKRGKDVPNVAIDIHWANGEDTVYTGLKPERGLGYADFEAPPGSYSVTIENAQSETAENLNIGEPPANCRNDRGQTPRGWKIVFKQK